MATIGKVLGFKGQAEAKQGQAEAKRHFLTKGTGAQKGQVDIAAL